MFDFLKNVSNGKEVTLFSDSRGGQNRSINICPTLLHAVQSMDIPEINQYFFKPGHSQM